MLAILSCSRCIRLNVAYIGAGVVRLLQLLLVTNAAGALNRDYNVGDIMMINDHFALPCLAGKHPLVGRNNALFGPRFPPLSDAYDPRYVFGVGRSLK